MWTCHYQGISWYSTIWSLALNKNHAFSASGNLPYHTNVTALRGHWAEAVAILELCLTQLFYSLFVSNSLSAFLISLAAAVFPANFSPYAWKAFFSSSFTHNFILCGSLNESHGFYDDTGRVVLLFSLWLLRDVTSRQKSAEHANAGFHS